MWWRDTYGHVSRLATAVVRCTDTILDAHCDIQGALVSDDGERTDVTGDANSFCDEKYRASASISLDGSLIVISRHRRLRFGLYVTLSFYFDPSHTESTLQPSADTRTRQQRHKKRQLWKPFFAKLGI